MARTRYVHDLLDRLAAEEGRFLAGEFLAPAVRGGVAHLRVGGARCGFERPDGRADPAAAAYLRRALAEKTAPDRVRRPGLTAEQRAAYALVVELRRRAERDRTEDRLRGAVAHAGGALHGYAEQ